MKKTFVILLTLLLITTLFGCKAENDEDQGLGLPNPMHGSTSDEILNELGITFHIPDNAGDTKYYIIDSQDGPRTAQAEFTLDDIKYIYRIRPAAEFEDISGAYYDWDNVKEAEISYCSGEVRYNEGKEGICLWYDVVPGLMYSLFTDKGASEDTLITAADTLYAPAQDAPQLNDHP